jgi:EamA-like transporter family.
MQNNETRTATYGPWLVGLGAALWGTESAWRIPLNELFDAKVIVFWEHVFILIMFLPILISRLDEIPRVRARTWGFLIFSGFAGSAVGTVFFTLALKYGNPTVVNVVLNIQPVISTLGAFLFSVIALLASSSFTLGSQSSQACLYRLRIRLRSEFHLSARV